VLSGVPELAGRAASDLVRGALERERRAAVLSGGASPAAGALPEELLPALRAALPEEWNPSQLEQHATCAYRFFAGHVLGLAEPAAAEVDIDPRDEGSLAHAVLEQFLRRRLQRGALPLRGAPDELPELRAAAEEIFGRFEADGRTGDPAAWSGRRAAVLRRLERVVAAEAEEPGDALPALLEYKFGGSSGVPPLVLADPEQPGEEVRLRGRLDRVDASADRLLLLDYKDTRINSEWKKKLEPEAFGDTNFQVPVYLMAAARALPGRRQLEASYVFLRSAERLEPYAAEADSREVIDGFAKAVVSKVRGIRSGLLPIASRDCSHCAFGAVCRFQTLAEAAP
jgi:RecB family exonuclease